MTVLSIQQKSLKFLAIIALCVFMGASNAIPSSALSQPMLPYLWQAQTIEKSEGGLSVSIKFDPGGVLHMALGRGRLYYATFNGIDWNNIQVVDNTPGTGQPVSLAFDSHGNPHIAYQYSGIYDEPTGHYSAELRYAYWNGVRWITQTVTSAKTSSVILALDPLDKPHLVFNIINNSALAYASWTGSQWNVQQVDVCNGVFFSPGGFSLAVSPDSTPHVIYECGGLKHASRTGSQWNIATLDSDNVDIGGTSLKFDSTGHAHIAYYANSSDHQLRYISQGAAGWNTFQVVDTNTATLSRIHLIMDGQDLPHIGYFSGNIFKYAVPSGIAWQIDVVPSAPYPEEDSSLVLDDNGDAHLAYVSYLPGQILYSHQDANTHAWTAPQVVNNTTWPGLQASIAVDANNSPHVIYLDDMQFQLKYAHLDNGQWATQIVDGNVGANNRHVYSSIKVDGNGVPHIAYFGVGGLKYASLVNGAWEIQAVLSENGQYASLALDQTSGYPRISYCGGGTLRYASWDGVNWSVYIFSGIACGAGDFGGETSLALDNNGNPHIAYNTNDATPYLGYVFYDGSQWSGPQIVDDQGSAGRALVVDSQGNPHIAYCGLDFSLSDLWLIRYASWNGSAWDKVTVDADHYCQLVFLAMDSHDHPHLSYPNVPDDTIRYAYFDGNAWAVQTVASNLLLTGWSYYTPVAVGPNGAPWIVYHNQYSGDALVSVRTDAKGIAGNAGVGGALLNYTDGNGIPQHVASDSNGNYSLLVPAGWSGTLTPSRLNATFTPPSRSYSNIQADQTSQNFTARVVFRSNGSQDGEIWESKENSNTGGALNAVASYFELGDTSANQQLRGILSFDTSTLPDTAVIQSVVLKIKQNGNPLGANPFNILGKLYVDIRKAHFGTLPGLQLSDFNASASAVRVGSFNKTPASGWYTLTLNATGRSKINKAGFTQFRLYFALDDNNDGAANLMKFFSGNAATLGNRPQLIITDSAP